TASSARSRTKCWCSWSRKPERAGEWYPSGRSQSASRHRVFRAAPRPTGPQPRDGLRRLQRRCRMFYELRRYDVAAGKLAALVDRFGSFTVHKWKQYGFRLIGFWTPVVADRSNQLVYIWGWESLEERAKKNAAWRADPERAKKWAETEKDGPL